MRYLDRLGEVLVDAVTSVEKEGAEVLASAGHGVRRLLVPPRRLRPVLLDARPHMVRIRLSEEEAETKKKKKKKKKQKQEQKQKTNERHNEKKKKKKNVGSVPGGIAPCCRLPRRP